MTAASTSDAVRCAVDCLHPEAIRPILGRSLGGDVALVLGMSVSALSQQLRFLHQHGALSRRMAGRIACHSLVDHDLQRRVLVAPVQIAAGAT